LATATSKSLSADAGALKEHPIASAAETAKKRFGNIVLMGVT